MDKHCIGCFQCKYAMPTLSFKRIGNKRHINCSKLNLKDIPEKERCDKAELTGVTYELRNAIWG